MTKKPAGKKQPASGRDALPSDAVAFQAANRQYINLARLPVWRSAWIQPDGAPVGGRDISGILIHTLALLVLVLGFGWFIFYLQR